MKRRQFLQRAAAAGAAAALTPDGGAEAPADGEAQNKRADPSPLPRRAYGKTGIELSVIGFGGILVTDETPERASAMVKRAIDCGVNYFDVAPSYGNAEERLGPALEPYRSRVFLACKTLRRDRAGAAEELARSLARLRTDHVDLYQLHSLTQREDLEQALGPGGALEAFQAARDRGQIRYIGFSAHSAEVAVEAMRRFPFDSILFPINFATYHKAAFGPQVIREAVERGVARLALKALAKQTWAEGADRSRHGKCWYEPLTDPGEAELALRFTLSQPVTAAVTPGHMDLFESAVAIAGRLRPLDAEESARLVALAEGCRPIFRLAEATGTGS